MRLSVDSDDPGYPLWRTCLAEGREVKVFLNGEEMKHVDLCDDQEGLVRLAVLDADGRVQVDPNNPEGIWRETLRGEVRIDIGDPKA